MKLIDCHWLRRRPAPPADWGSASFTVTVENVAPTVTAGPDRVVDEGSQLTLQVASFTDPGTLDYAHGLDRLGRRLSVEAWHCH